MKKTKNKIIETALYNFGEYSQKETIDLSDLENMQILDSELLGFDIRKEDEGKTFYADPAYIDEDADGTAVKYAYAIKNFRRL